MSRQMERAENMARILGVTCNLVLFATKDAQQQKTLLAPLSITETDSAFFDSHKQLTLPALLDFMALDEKIRPRSTPASSGRARTRTRCAGRSPRRCGRR